MKIQALVSRWNLTKDYEALSLLKLLSTSLFSIRIAEVLVSKSILVTSLQGVRCARVGAHNKLLFPGNVPNGHGIMRVI